MTTPQATPNRPAQAQPRMASTGAHANPPPTPAPAQGRRWSRTVAWFGIAFSISVHLGLLIIAATMLTPAHGTGGAGDTGEVPLALMASSELTSLEQQQPTDSLVLESLDMPEQFFELSAMEATAPGMPIGDLAMDQSIDFGGASSIDFSSGAAVPAAGTAGTSFFGVEVRGSRIAYIVDVSGSMVSEGRLDELQRQLIASINELPEHGHFVIVSFQSVARSLMGREWTPATRANKEAAAAEINNLIAAGGTVPGPAFAGIFELSPRPDAVYFMTDGEFEQYAPALVSDIETWNRQARRPSPIYCITFGTDVARVVMERIADRSGGSYTHVESVP
ncbi:MAG: hypothetical protein ACTS3F_03405 [Phycisphaerales bacterium]